MSISTGGRERPSSFGQQIGSLSINSAAEGDISGVKTINLQPYPPIGEGGELPVGTALNDTLRWDTGTSAWVSNSSVQCSVAGVVSATAIQNPAGTLTVESIPVAGTDIGSVGVPVGTLLVNNVNGIPFSGTSIGTVGTPVSSLRVTNVNGSAYPPSVPLTILSDGSHHPLMMTEGGLYYSNTRVTSRNTGSEGVLTANRIQQNTAGGGSGLILEDVTTINSAQPIQVFRADNSAATMDAAGGCDLYEYLSLLPVDNGSVSVSSPASLRTSSRRVAGSLITAVNFACTATITKTNSNGLTIRHARFQLRIHINVCGAASSGDIDGFVGVVSGFVAGGSATPLTRVYGGGTQLAADPNYFAINVIATDIPGEINITTPFNMPTGVGFPIVLTGTLMVKTTNA